MSPRNMTQCTRELQPDIKATIPLAELEVQETALLSEQLRGTEPQNYSSCWRDLQSQMLWPRTSVGHISSSQMCSLSQVCTARDRLFLYAGVPSQKWVRKVCSKPHQEKSSLHPCVDSAPMAILWVLYLSHTKEHTTCCYPQQALL